MQTTQKRLNHIMLMHIHKERTDKIDLIKVANEFVEWKDNRRQIFGTFSPTDISRQEQPVRVNLLKLENIHFMYG